MREKKQNNPQPTNPLFLKMQNITDFLNLPFIEVLKLVMKGAVEDYLTESGVMAALAAIPAKATKKDNEGLNAEEALDFLNANGYPIKKGQLYKETSANTIHTRSLETNFISRHRNCLHGLRANSLTATP